MPHPVKPGFLGIGAQKCASTWLHDILSDHPQACLGRSKEIDFFSHRYDFGFQWYERQFQGPDGHKAVGEVSPSYFHGIEVPRRVFEYDPRMRLILFLRDPVSRAMSNHRHEVRLGHVAGDDLSFEFGLRNNPSYVEQGLYATHLERWLGLFPRQQILIVLVDDIVSNPAEAARSVYRFLQVDEAHAPRALNARSNESHVNRYRWMESARYHARRFVRLAGASRLWEAAANLGARRLYRRLNRSTSDTIIPPMCPSTRLQLQQTFEPEIRRLEQILGRSLEAWR